MGRTKKPCPGCGVVNTARSPDEVCCDCKRLIEEAKANRERMARETESGVFQLAYHYYSLPYIAHVKREPLQQAFQEMVYSVRGPVFGNEHWNVPPLVEKSETGYGQEWAGRFPLAFREHANRLYKEIQKATEAAYKEGYKDGQNLIVQLARGDISLNEYREESGERARSRR